MSLLTSEEINLSRNSSTERYSAADIRELIVHKLPYMKTDVYSYISPTHIACSTLRLISRCCVSNQSLKA